eukprot:snap_masked-scaffold685_size112133-processed-gene-0.8 protein:Tk02075 transcript:snap_masked-scaffold685_size112133-processed-gene-0.8-mRNA-1 annotation:"fungal specific transcription factor"
MDSGSWNNRDPKCSEQSPCSFKLFCGENAFPTQFKAAQGEVETEGKTTYRLGNGKETTDSREAQVELWARDHQDSKDQTASLMVPHLYIPIMSDVPNDKRESYKTVGVIEKILDQLLGDTPLKTIPEVINALSQYVAGYSESIDISKLWQDQMSNYRHVLASKHGFVGNKGAGVPKPPTSSDEDVVTWMTSCIPERDTKLKNRLLEEICQLLADKKRLLAQLLACLLLGWNLAQAHKLFRSANNLSGDHLERDTKNVTFAGLKVSWRNEEGEPCNGEFDFLAFFGRQRQIVQIACKTKLTGKVAAKVREQARKCFEFLQANLSVTPDWTFVPVTCYSSKDQSLSLCDECRQFVCDPAHLGSTLASIKAKEVESCEDLSEYETLVREFNFRATSNVHLKQWGKKSTHHHDPH